MIDYSHGIASNWLYLHSGHWDLWTTLVASLAFTNPNGAPLIFSWGSLPPYVLTSWSMTTYLQTQEQPRTKWIPWIQGGLSMIVLVFAGGPEIAFNTTNTQWILCIYVAFRLAHLSELHNPRPGRWGFSVDALAVLSSFAGTILLPAQFISIGFFQKRKLTEWKHFLTASAGLWLGFIVQVISSILQYSATTINRGLQPWAALKGFFLQGISGIFIPVEFASRYLADGDSNAHLATTLLVGISSLALILSLFGKTGQPGTRQQTSIASLTAILITTFLYCQLAIGNKNELLLPGIGLRYFAPERILVTWLLICVAMNKGSSLTNKTGQIKQLTAGVAATLIMISGWSYFKTDSLQFFGMTKNSCGANSHRSFSRLNHRWPRSTNLPICPNGWTITL